MTDIELIDLGTLSRENNQPLQALSYYGQAFIANPDSASAFNNYGNTLRELGQPGRATPFIEHAIRLVPNQPTFNFNLAVCQLLEGNYRQGFRQYEWRWQFEHLAGLLPTFSQPRWTGQDLKDKTLFLIGEQGHGDIIQFSRFAMTLHAMGARIIMQVTEGLVSLFRGSEIISAVLGPNEAVPDFDYWIPMMSVPAVLDLTLDSLPRLNGYLAVNPQSSEQWRQRLGPKTRLRVGVSWSGRRDSWINRHKSVPFEQIVDLIKRNQNIEWINLQIDAEPKELQELESLGVCLYPGSIGSFADTASLMMNLDLIISVDTAVSHLAGALARPTWIMLNQYAVDWRWLLNRNDSPWYPTAKLFRQPTMGDWTSVIKQLNWHLEHFKA